MFLSNQFKYILFSMILVLSFLITAPAVLAIDANSTGLDTTAKIGYGGNLPAITSPTLAIGKVVGAALAFLGVVFFVLMIYGGYLWMFSMGNEQTVTKAKDVVIAAAIGLIIILMAYVITSFIGATFTAT